MVRETDENAGKKNTGKSPMKDIVMKLLLSIIVIALTVGGCSYFNRTVGMKNDNPAEEILESVIEHHFDLPPDSLDLTP